MEARSHTLDPPAVGGVPPVDGTPTPAMREANTPPRFEHPHIPDPPKTNPGEKVKITLTRVRELQSKSRQLAKAYREFNVIASKLLAGRESEAGTFVVALEGARLDVQEGSIEEANVRVTLLAEEFESLHG